MLALHLKIMERQHVGKRLRQARTAASLTQGQLAKRIGVSRGVISQWETGLIESIGASHLAACARVLGVTLDWLLTETPAVEETAAPDYAKPDDAELLNAWALLTASQRQRYLEQIVRDAAHNAELLEELSKR
jgi:transcriptional regulator with XRE-family HTH domain